MDAKTAIFNFSPRGAEETQKKIDQLLSGKGIKFLSAVQSQSSVVSVGGVITTDITLTILYSQEQ